MGPGPTVSDGIEEQLFRLRICGDYHLGQTLGSIDSINIVQSQYARSSRRLNLGSRRGVHRRSTVRVS